MGRAISLKQGDVWGNRKKRRFRAKHGHRMVADLRYSSADAILATMAHTPAAANNLRKVLIELMDFAVKMRWRSEIRKSHSHL